jgi:hypothetical protein
MLRHGDQRLGFITEMGAVEQTSTDLGPYFEWMKLDPEVRGRYLVKALQRANTNYPWVQGAMLFNLDYSVSGLSTAEGWFSLLNMDRSPRAAYRYVSDAHTRGDLP